jgi:hypothetical protein
MEQVGSAPWESVGAVSERGREIINFPQNSEQL